MRTLLQHLILCLLTASTMCAAPGDYTLLRENASGPATRIYLTPQGDNLVTFQNGIITTVPRTTIAAPDLSSYLTITAAQAAYVSLTGSYANPSWLTSLPFSKLTGTPTTLAGYGILDGLTSSAAASTYVALGGSYTNPSWLVSLPFSKLTSTPTTLAGYGISDGLTSATAASTYVALAGSYTNPTWLASIPFSKLTSTPTSLAGYGILDGLTSTSALNADNITSGTLNDMRLSANVTLLGAQIDLTSEVINTLPLEKGGTSATTAAGARVALLPSLTTNAGKMLRVNAGATDVEWVTPAGGGDALTTNPLSQFAATTSAQLRGVLTDESGTGEFLTTNGSAASLTNFPTFNQNTTGNAATATALQTGRTINGVTFDGTANITVTAAADTLTGTSLPVGVTGSSLTSVGTISTGVWQGSIIAPQYLGTGTEISTKFLRGDGSYQALNFGDAVTTNPLSQFAATTSAQLRGVLTDESGTGEFLTTNGSAAGLTNFPTFNQNTTGNAATATALQTGRTINGVTFDGTANITVAAAAGTLTGTTLAAGVTGSSLTSVGTIASGVWQGTAIQDAYIASAATWNAKESALTFSTGLTRLVNTITVNSTQSISKLSNLTSNGLVTTSGGDGTLSVDTTTQSRAIAIEYIVACSDETTAITTGTAKVSFRVPVAMTVTSVEANMNTGPAGSAAVFDINEGGASILGTKISVDDGETSSADAATPPTITDTSIAARALITIDFDQVGASSGGTGVKITIIGTRN